MRNILAKRFSFALLTGLVTLGPRGARAADAPGAAALPVSASGQADDPERRLAIMNGEIELFAARARAQRRANVVVGLVGAAALVPAGYVLSQRTDAVSQSIGIGMEVGGIAPLAFSALSLSRSPMERLRDRVDDEVASSMPRAELVRVIESDWQSTAEAAHDRRIVVGVVGLVLGTASTAAGLFFLLSNPVAGLSLDQQYTLGSSLVGPGVPFIGVGIRALFQESVEETSWDSYRAMSGAAHSVPQTSPGFSFGGAPLRGGGVAALAYSF
jgi:hypothetical protein